MNKETIKPPAYLDKVGKSEWNRVVKEIGDRIENLDISTLAAYCDNYSRYIEASNKMKTEGMVMTTSTGYQQISPYVTIADKSLKIIMSLSKEFGFTPLSRNRLNVQPEEEDAFEEYLGN